MPLCSISCLTQSSGALSSGRGISGKPIYARYTPKCFRSKLSSDDNKTLFACLPSPDAIGQVWTESMAREERDMHTE